MTHLQELHASNSHDPKVLSLSKCKLITFERTEPDRVVAKLVSPDLWRNLDER